jgi:hypothetical protein
VKTTNAVIMGTVGVMTAVNSRKDRVELTMIGES